MAPTTRAQAASESVTSLTRSHRSSTLDEHATGHNGSGIHKSTETISVVPSDFSTSDIPQRYTIDLSLPPSQRYVQVARDYKLILQNLTGIFDALLEDYGLPKRGIHQICRMLLHRLYSKEQHEELKGISKEIDVPMYLLIAYNVLLDLFMGCTSGGILVKEPGEDKKMLHYRTLDWGMPELRAAIAQFEYKQKADGPIIATSVGYVGFVGILTGVRPGLSLSLNFRPYHNNDSSSRANFRFYAHQVLVLLGFRPSIASILRSHILPPSKRRTWNLFTRTREQHPPPHTQDLATITTTLPSIPSTSCYITLSNGTRTCVLEKDLRTAKLLSSTTFIAVTNHDAAYEARDVEGGGLAPAPHKKKHAIGGAGMQDIIDESIGRKAGLYQKWEQRVRSLQYRRKGGVPARSETNTEKGGVEGELEGSQDCYVRMKMLKEWMGDYPITNSDTHFLVVMDAERGEIVWVRAYESPMYEEEEEEEEEEDEEDEEEGEAGEEEIEMQSIDIPDT